MDELYSILPRTHRNIDCVKTDIDVYKKAIRVLAKHYRVRVCFYKDKPNYPTGIYRGKTKTIHLAVQTNMLKTFFHELGHHHCRTNGIWTAYHSAWDLTLKELRSLRYTALKAERWVDRWGEQEMKKWFPRWKYAHSYLKPDVVKWLREYWGGYIIKQEAWLRRNKINRRKAA
jgi:hypothetical protein